MEEGETKRVFEEPAHPYTRALLDAAPVPDPEVQRARRRARSTATADGDITVPPDACPFAPRCTYAIELCRTKQPLLEPTDDGRWIACHRWRELRARAADAHVSGPATW